MKKTQPDTTSVFLDAEILNERAAKYAYVEEKAELQGALVEFLAFKLGTETYLAETKLTAEVLPLSRIAKLPRRPECLHGLVNVRGNLVPIADLRRLLGLGAVPPDAQSRIILLERKTERTGFIVDEVTHYMTFDTGLMQPPIAALQGTEAELIKGLFRTKDRSYIWLNLERILNNFQSRLASQN